MDKELLVAEEVAELLRIDKQRVYELTRRGFLPGVIRLGQRQYRYSAPALQELIGGSQLPNECEAVEKGGDHYD